MVVFKIEDRVDDCEYRLPNDHLAVAGSRHAQGNCIALFALGHPDKLIYSTYLDSGHGVVWDAGRKTLWALGYDGLLALRLKNWETANPELELARAYEIPDESGHDLVPVPGSNDLILTTDKRVFLFDRERQTFRPHPDLGDKPAIKSVSIHPRTGQTVYIQAEGTDWWASRIRMLNPVGEVLLPGERLYKARWNPR